MRFLHLHWSDIEAFLVMNPAPMVEHEVASRPIARGFWFLSERREARDPRNVGLDDVRAYELATKKLERLGTGPREYIHVNAAEADKHVPLSDAVEYVEAQAAPNEFLLVGYADGGFISVSRERMPFQTGLSEATWWRPTRDTH